jgi:N-acetylated-alpha-linked acidic dipeptidase
VKREDLAALNDALMKVERAFLLEKGLVERPWFKHSIYAPGLTTGYACWPLPAIRQDLEENNKTRLASDLQQTVERIKKATAAVESARERAHAALKTR